MDGGGEIAKSYAEPIRDGGSGLKSGERGRRSSQVSGVGTMCGERGGK